MAFEFITQPIFGVLGLCVHANGQHVWPYVRCVHNIHHNSLFHNPGQQTTGGPGPVAVFAEGNEGFQQEIMAAQKSGDAKAMAEVQKKQAEFMDLQKEMMMNSFKPMIVTFIPILLVFWWMAAEPAINKLVVELPSFVFYVLLVPLFHMFYQQSPGVPYMAIEWLGWYILCSFAMSIIFRKFMGLKSGGI